MKSADISVLQRAAVDTDADAAVALLHSAPVYLLHSRSKNVAAMLAAMQHRPDVDYVEPNYIVEVSAAPADTWFADLWGLRNSGQSILGGAGIAGADISAAAAWDVSTGSRANVVAVLDTGTNYNHPDLAANIWSAPAAYTVTVNGTAITCPGGSHGFNAVANTCDPNDDHGHGTHVSGTIGALGNNSTGVTGVNWTASILPLKVLGADGSGSIANIVRAIDFAIQTKSRFGSAANIRVFSASFSGTGFSQAFSDAISRANAADILFVAAAGNYGQNNDIVPMYPASYALPNVIAVAATDNRDQLATFSNSGAASVHLAAPGVNIESTAVGGGYQWMSGTSMATPHVSGAAVLVLSVCTLNTAALRNVLISTVDPVPALAGRTSTGGRLNVNRAIRSCAAPTPAPAPQPGPAPTTGFTPIRINAGGATYTDGAGQVWAADTGYLAGNSYAVSTPIANTTTPALYQSVRYNSTGGSLQYRFAVPNGSYTVRLKFAEIYYASTGQRVFNIALNGQTVETRFDAVAAAGGAFKAVDRTYSVNASAGQIALDLIAVADNPAINAIEITAAAAPAPIRINAGGAAYTDSLGQVWAADSGYVAGVVYVNNTSIANTNAAPLYQSVRFNRGAALQYRFAVPNGNYTVRLKFAELYYRGTGQRVFNIVLNGQTVETRFDAVGAAGSAFKAVDRTYTLNVTNGQIAIDLTPVIDNPAINAIEITPIT